MLACALLGLYTNSVAQSEDPVELVHADRVTLEKLPSGNAYRAEGRVHFRQGPSQLYADRAIWFEESNEVHLFGHVKVSDTTETLSCDTLYYIKSLDVANAHGHVEYRRPDEQIVATSKSGTYHRGDRRAELYDEAVMIQHPDDERRTETWADTLVFESGNRAGEARGHVRVVRSDGNVTAQKATFRSEGVDDHILFEGEPHGAFGGNEVSGDSLVVTLRQNKMESLHAKGNAQVRFQESSSQGRTTTSDITSDHIVLSFREGQLRDLVAVGQAKCRYVPAWGRENERNDASGDTVKITLADSTVQRVQVISGAVGTYFTPQGDSAGAHVDTIQYASSYIDYKVDNNTIRLWDHAEVNYGEVNLEAGQIVYQTDVAVLRAYALDDTLLAPPSEYRAIEPSDTVQVTTPPDTAVRVDTTVADTAEVAIDGETARQLPVLRQGAQVVNGDRLVYDIPTRRGRIVRSSTAAQDGYYSGGDFRLESARTFYVEDGAYTTCDLDPPHFDFAGGRMKVREKDRVIARPVVMHIEQVPVMWLPYYVFSIKPDRHSGMLPLRFGNFERGSRYVRNIGYYFAVSDYWDIAPALDVVEREGVLWHLLTSYALRYKLAGSLFGSYNRHTAVTTTGEQTTTRWNALFSHSQELSPTATLSGSGNFVSDNSFYQDFTADPNFRLNRRLRSQLNFNKRWQSSSFILAVDDSRNLDDDSRESILPRYALSLPQRQLFYPGRLKGGRLEDPRWYHQFRAGFTSIGQNLVSETAPDSLTKLGKHYMTADHRFELNFSGKAGPVALTPGLSLEETWYYVYSPTNSTLAGGVDTLPTGLEAEQFYRRLSGSFRVSSQTNVYGIFNLQRGNLMGFRHVFTPSLSLSLSPAVTENNAVRSYTGVGGGGPRSTVLSAGLGNLFQMKTRSGESERTWDLLNVGMSGSYNFEGLGRKMSFISTSIRSGLVRNPDLSLSLVHDPYDPVTGDFDWSPRLASITTSVTFRLSGKGGVPSGSSVGQGGYYETSGGADIEGTSGNLGGFGGISQARTWDFSTSYQFAETRTPDPTAPGNTLKNITHWLRPNFRFNPTPAWDVQTNLYYDVVRQTMNDWTIRLHRDLHCWEAEFSWVVTGARAGYYFRINVKRLSSLKFEKNEGGLQDAFLGALPGT